MAEKAEVVDRELEVAPSLDLELNQGKLDAIIKFAEQTDKIGRALDNIRKFVLTRALPGDWVKHGENLNLTGPGAERVISSLGMMGVSVTLRDWGSSKDSGTDKNGEWLTWWYWADVEIGSMRLGRIEGRAGSRDKFFGFAHDKWKDIADVKEPDIRMAARRGVFKEAVKVALGLRSIPAASAEALGLDTRKIKTVEYGSGGNTQSAAKAEAAGTPLVVKDVRARTITKKNGDKSVVYVIEDEKGATYETFSETVAEAARILKGQKALFDYTPATNPKFAPKLKSISAADGSEIAPEPVDESEQEPIG